jgi:phage tail-like protein
VSDQQGGATAVVGAPADPYRAYNFKLVIQGVTAGHFTECTSLGVKVEAISYREGGAGEIVRKVPGPVTYGDVTLRYGLTASRELWDWFTTVVRGSVQRRNVSILILGSDGATEMTRWDLVNAWPSEWRGAPLDAMNKEIAVESLTLVFESLDRA